MLKQEIAFGNISKIHFRMQYYKQGFHQKGSVSKFSGARSSHEQRRCCTWQKNFLSDFGATVTLLQHLTNLGK